MPRALLYHLTHTADNMLLLINDFPISFTDVVFFSIVTNNDDLIAKLSLWTLITDKEGLIILILTLGFDLSVHLCPKPYIKVEFYVGYFQ